MFYLGLSILVVFNFNSIICQRRIVNGRPADNVKFMAYFVSSPFSENRYAAWLCGGSIVHPIFILTSATCIEDVDKVYAIAGYKRYVQAEMIETDECTKRMKKKVVSFCREIAYKIKIETDDWWNWENVALARVETPFDFQDKSYLLYCSYIPTYININYNKEFQRPGRDVVTLGWGSSEYYRPEGDEHDYNEKYLLYGSSFIISKEECRPPYQPSGGRFNKHIDKHWICIMQLYGRLDVHGNIEKTFSDAVLSCEDRHELRSNSTGECIDERGFRRFYNYNKTVNNEKLYVLPTRRAGICQNDHGGPLITWIGGLPYVIGVATAFLVDQNMRCRGPFVFCSTYCNSRVVHCIMRSQMGRRSGYCGENSYHEQKFEW